MRAFTANVLLGLLATLQPNLAGERNVFRYGEGDSSGALIHDYANRWVEFVGSKESYLFEETGRSNDTIELLDHSRDVGLKVHAQAGELRLPGSTDWQPWRRADGSSRTSCPATSISLPPIKRFASRTWSPTIAPRSPTMKKRSASSCKWSSISMRI